MLVMLPVMIGGKMAGPFVFIINCYSLAGEPDYSCFPPKTQLQDRNFLCTPWIASAPWQTWRRWCKNDAKMCYHHSPFSCDSFQETDMRQSDGTRLLWQQKPLNSSNIWLPASMHTCKVKLCSLQSESWGHLYWLCLLFAACRQLRVTGKASSSVNAKTLATDIYMSYMTTLRY